MRAKRIGLVAMFGAVLATTGCVTMPRNSDALTTEGELYQVMADGWLTPRAYAEIKMGEIYAACQQFFDSAVKVNQSAGLIQSMLTAAPALATAVVAASKISIWTTGMALAATTVEAFAREFAFPTVFGEVLGAINEAMRINGLELLDLIVPTAPRVEQFAAAYRGLIVFANNCSTATIRRAVTKSLSAAANNLVPAGQTGVARHEGGMTIFW